MRAILVSFRFLTLAVLLAMAMPSRAAYFNGQYYVPLADFARANGFSCYQQKHGGELALQNKSTRMVFDVNSAQAQIAGVNVRLSFPVASQSGQFLVSQLDIDTAIRPLLYPQKSYGKRITTICLDPGHGGKDSGNHVGGIFGHSEKTYTLALALELRQQLERAGYRVILTRSRDVYVDLPTRPAIGNRNGADLFISLHFNATPADKADISGPETYCITPTGAPSSNSHGEGGEFGSLDHGQPRRRQKPRAGVPNGKNACDEPPRERPRCAARAFRGIARRDDAGDFDRGRLYDAPRGEQKDL
jgi:N-acetylmuramoyl-L-alanine amidase